MAELKRSAEIMNPRFVRWRMIACIAYAAIGTWPAIVAISSSVGRQQAGASAVLGIYGFPSTLVPFLYVGLLGSPGFEGEVTLCWVFMLINACLMYFLATKIAKRGPKKGIGAPKG